MLNVYAKVGSLKIRLKINQSLYFATHHLEYISYIIRNCHLIPVNLIQFIKWAKYDGSHVATCRLRRCCRGWLLLQDFDFFISLRIISHSSRCYRQTYFPWQRQALRLSWRNWPLRQGLHWEGNVGTISQWAMLCGPITPISPGNDLSIPVVPVHADRDYTPLLQYWDNKIIMVTNLSEKWVINQTRLKMNVSLFV